MGALRTVVSALGADDLPGDDTDPEVNIQRSIRLTARFPTIVAAYARIRNGEEPIAPLNELKHAANFLYMLNGTKPSAGVEQIMDTCLVLHA